VPRLQTRRRPTPSYLETVQTDVNSSMRGILVDWLVEVSQRCKCHLELLWCRCAARSQQQSNWHHIRLMPTWSCRHSLQVCQEFRLVSDTLFLAVSYLDRYLSLIPVTRNRLQLVGVTCLLLASKYEEIYAPQVSILLPLVGQNTCLMHRTHSNQVNSLAAVSRCCCRSSASATVRTLRLHNLQLACRWTSLCTLRTTHIPGMKCWPRRSRSLTSWTSS
jgi:Cyclin, N-terminal domain